MPAPRVFARYGFTAFTLLCSCGGQSSPPQDTTDKTRTPEGPGKTDIPESIRAAVNAPDRAPDDTKLDGGRKPAELLAFAGVRPGMKVADLGAGTGYTTELLVRAVGPSGVVYGQNSQDLIDRFLAKPWEARLAKPVNAKVVKVTRNFDDPLPAEARDLDLVFDVLFYHDTVWLKVDRDKMNAAVFAALKPGGRYIVVDHSGRPGTGTTETESLHRIEESVVKAEVLRAGFRLDGQGDFLRNSGDTRDWNAAPFAAGARRGQSDRFVLRFVKP